MLSARAPRPPSAARKQQQYEKNLVSTSRGSRPTSARLRFDRVGLTAHEEEQNQRDPLGRRLQTPKKCRAVSSSVGISGGVELQLTAKERELLEDPAGPPGRQLAGCIDESRFLRSGEAASVGRPTMEQVVKYEIDAFEAKKSRRLVPTLVPPGMQKNKAKEAAATAKAQRKYGLPGERRASDASLNSLQQQKQRREELFDTLRVRWHAKDAEADGVPSEIPNGIERVEGVNYNDYQKPMDLGTTKMMRWLLDLKSLRQSDLIVALRKYYKITDVLPELKQEGFLLPHGVPLVPRDRHHSPTNSGPSSRRRSSVAPSAAAAGRAESQSGRRHSTATHNSSGGGGNGKHSLYLHGDAAIRKLRSIWLRHCKVGKSMTMPNATVAFHGFLNDALPEEYFVEKKQAEVMYRQLNDHRTQPLEYHQAFLKFLLVLTDLSECDGVSLGHYMYLYFSTAYKVWSLDTDFAQTVDFQLIVTTFEDLTIGCFSSDDDSISKVANSSSYSSKRKKDDKGNPHKETLQGFIKGLREDIMSGYAVKRPIRNYVHVGPALDLFRESTFVQMLRKSAPKVNIDDGTFEGAHAAKRDELALADVLPTQEEIQAYIVAQGKLTHHLEDDDADGAYFAKPKQTKKELTLLQKFLGHEEKDWEKEMVTAPHYKKLERNTTSFNTWVTDILKGEARHMLFRLKPPADPIDLQQLLQPTQLFSSSTEK